MATDKKPKVLVVGGGTYLGYHILDRLNGIFDLTATYTVMDHMCFSPPPWVFCVLEWSDMKGSLKRLMELGGYDWVVLSPEAIGTQRTLVAQILIDTMQETHFSGSVVVLSHDGVNQFAEKYRCKKMAELFSFEKAIFAMKHLKRVYSLRIAMLQEQLLFALPTANRSGVVSLPVDLDLVNPIAAIDVVSSVCNIISGKASGYSARRTRWTSYLTGLGSHFRHVRLKTVSSSAPPFCSDPHGSSCRSYYEWLDRFPLHCYSISLPYWPADAEIELMREYFWYAGWPLGPAKEAQMDWNEICPGADRQPLATLLNIIHDQMRQ
ncbi:hypothetical protein BG006_009386 [Podila minutissima]|uniref:NAD(P)-binding domain-containing protein n=1 Tax=Podila minutissima TaxID=64525 RepID=A0A9P5VIY2_9FUNG|nr:hypothetical protein BG006_009386 [Podila minutissima]